MTGRENDTDRDLLDALKGYYDAFINIEDTKGFFYGLADYVEFVGRVPLFEGFSKELFAKRRPYEERIEVLQGPAAERLEAIKKELADYVAEHKIEDPVIQQSLKAYDGWRTKKIIGSNGPLDGMHDVLRDAVEFLYKLPEHKEFAKRYIQFWEGNPELIKHYLPVKEFDVYREAEEEYKKGMKNELWGQMGSISWQYQVIRHGEERRKKLTEEYERTRSSETSWELMNHNILNGEWQHIVEDRRTGHRIYFFNVSEVRQTIVRFQNQLVAEVLLKKYVNKAPDGVLLSAGFADVPDANVAEGPFKPRLLVHNKIGYLRLFDKDAKRRVAGIGTRQFRLVRCLFNPSADIAALYEATFQTEERIYKAIALPKDKKDTRLSEPATKESRMHDIIENTITEIQKNKSVRQCLQFERDVGKMRLRITLPEGK